MAWPFRNPFAKRPAQPAPAPASSLPHVRWMPESCGCILRYESVDDRDHFHRPWVEKDCGAHGFALAPKEHFRRVLENDRAYAARVRASAQK